MGLSLHNMGDIAEQTLAGATSTGTHGTGGVWASLSAQIDGLELVTGTGEVVRATATENPELLELGRVGLGAIGILTTITFRVEPLFVLEANERPMGWDECLDGFDERVAAHHHVDTYWFPHTDRMLSKTNDRLDVDLSETSPLSKWRSWWDDEFLSNTLFGALNHVTNRFPRIIAPLNQVSGRLPVGSHLQRHRPPGLRLRAERRLPRDGVRRAARGRPHRAPRGPRRARGLRPPRSPSRSRSG